MVIRLNSSDYLTFKPSWPCSCPAEKSIKKRTVIRENSAGFLETYKLTLNLPVYSSPPSSLGIFVHPLHLYIHKELWKKDQNQFKNTSPLPCKKRSKENNNDSESLVLVLCVLLLTPLYPIIMKCTFMGWCCLRFGASSTCTVSHENSSQSSSHCTATPTAASRRPHRTLRHRDWCQASLTLHVSNTGVSNSTPVLQVFNTPESND